MQSVCSEASRRAECIREGKEGARNIMRTLLLLLLIAHLGTTTPRLTADNPYFQIQGQIGCNDDTLSQVPSAPDFFVGRVPVHKEKAGRSLPELPPGSLGSCDTLGGHFGLGLFRMNWTSFGLTYTKILAWPNAPLSIMDGRVRLTSLYDPTVAIIDGEIWISFECVGFPFLYASSCAGPLLKGPVEHSSLDLERTSLIVQAARNVAASVPKIFAHGRGHYLWFDFFLTEANYIEQRGIELAKDSRGRLFARGSDNASTIPTDHLSTVRVWSPRRAKNPLSSHIADVYSVTSVDGILLVTAGVGGASCPGPRNEPLGCYRLAVARTPFPLGEDTAPEFQLSPNALPGNSMEYGRVMTVPNVSGILAAAAGQLLLYAYFLTGRGNKTATNPGFPIPAGYIAFPRPNDPKFWGEQYPCSPAQRRSGRWGVRSGKCLRSCASLADGIVGVKASNSSCIRAGMQSLGVAFDTPYCCAPIECGDTAHPSPQWGTRGGRCLPSCGVLGGNCSLSASPCSARSMVDVGDAYDTLHCCAVVNK